MTKTVIQTGVILLAMAAAWLSLKTGQQTNQDASGQVMQALDNKVEAYRKENSDNFAAVIAHVDAGQTKTQDVTEQVKGVADTLVGIANTTNQILNQHTKSLEEVKTGTKEAKGEAAQAKEVAKRNQVQTQRAIREITKPKKSWWSGLFVSPTPHR